MADYGFGEVGNTLLPLPNPGGNSSLQDADPALFYILDFWGAMIAQYVDPRLLTELQATGLELTAGANGLAQRLPYDPTPWLRANQYSMPLLAVWREKGESEWLSAGYEHDRTTFGAAYVLPSLSAGQAERLLPILNAVYETIRKQSTQGWDPSYTPPGGTATTPGPWTSQFANLESIWVGKGGYEHGRWDAGGNLWFPCVTWKTLVVERDNFPPESVTNYQIFQGADITEGLVSADGSTINPFIQASTNPAPTIASLTATTGPYTGGTSVGIVGTGFQKPQIFMSSNPAVLFGSQPSTNVTFNSSTSLTAIAPAMLGPGPFTVAVTLVNPDGQSATLPAAFTFT